MPETRNSLQEDLFPSSLTLAEESEDADKFRKKLIFGLGVAKIFCGSMLGVFGLLSMNMEAAMSSLAGGVWAGAIAIATGLSAVCLTKCSKRAVHAIIFLCLSVASVLTAGLATVFVATGLAHDAQWPAGYYVDSDGRRVLFAGDIATRAPLLAVASVALTSAIADCALAVTCCIVAAQEACQCYVCADDEDDPVDQDSRVRHDRLVTWLGQQALMDFMIASGKIPDNMNPPNDEVNKIWKILIFVSILTVIMAETRNYLQEELFPSSLTLAEENADAVKHRKKLIFGLGVAKIFCGSMLGLFGLLSMNMEAAMSSLAGGVWAGAIAIVTGLFAVCLTKCSKRTVYAIIFLCLSVASVVTAGVATVFVATGLVHDAQLPTGYYVDSDGRRVLFGGDVATRAPLLAFTSVALTLAIADCALAVTCCVVAAQESCQCYVCADEDYPVDQDSRVRHDRLVTWLGQQALRNFMTTSGKIPDNTNPPHDMNNQSALNSHTK